MDPQTVAERYHEQDSTGMIATKGNYAEAFTTERKDMWLKAFKDSGLRFRQTCLNLGVSHHTINHHIAIDPEFKRRYIEAQEEYAEELEARQRAFALEPKHFMDRAMQLRALLPGKYARDERTSNGPTVNITLNGDLLMDAKKRTNIIDLKAEAESANFEAPSIGNTVANNNNADNR